MGHRSIALHCSGSCRINLSSATHPQLRLRCLAVVWWCILCQSGVVRTLMKETSACFPKFIYATASLGAPETLPSVCTIWKLVKFIFLNPSVFVFLLLAFFFSSPLSFAQYLLSSLAIVKMLLCVYYGLGLAVPQSLTQSQQGFCRGGWIGSV